MGLEHLKVDLPVANPKLVARRARDQQPGLEQAPEVRDVDLQRLVGGRGWVVAPERLDQVVAGDGLIGPQQEHREQEPLFGALAFDCAAVVPDFERPEDPEVQSPNLPSAPCPTLYRKARCGCLYRRVTARLPPWPIVQTSPSNRGRSPDAQNRPAYRRPDARLG